MLKLKCDCPRCKERIAREFFAIIGASYSEAERRHVRWIVVDSKDDGA